MATCHDKVYRLKVQQVNTRSLTPLQYNAVQFNRTATYIIFMKLIMLNICSDYTREALIGGCKIIIELNEYICDKVQCHSVQQLKHHKGSIILQGCYISMLVFMKLCSSFCYIGQFILTSDTFFFLLNEKIKGLY